MTESKASLTQGALIIGGFVVLALAVAGLVEAKLPPSGSHGASSHTEFLKVHVDTLPIVTVDMMTQKPADGIQERTLKAFYALRAYPGAPPMIPHKVDKDGVIADDCNSCHKDGGYAPEFNAYSPISPHPENENCRQCHLPAVTTELFVHTSWIVPEEPKRGRSMLPGSPPPIPHTLQLRKNCQACHVGPAAVREIRVSHPERENCQQCHVPSYTDIPFTTSFPLGSASDK